MTEEEKIAEALIGRLALAFQATASRFRACDPTFPMICDSIGGYMLDPERAEAQLVKEEAVDQKLAPRRAR